MANTVARTDTNPNRRKLTKQEELYVHRSVTTGESTKEELAVRFGVHFNTIGNIVRRQEERRRAIEGEV
ncbi:MAG: hypothetical protein KF784_02335 [Fimbriimonadaceae bacterium]|nr:hypothetical protein [Fimbriimonadaceae bacterium]